MKVFKIGFCYLPVCSCGLRAEFVIGHRLDAVWCAIAHLENERYQESWISGDELGEANFYDTPKLAITVVSRDEIHVRALRGNVVETIKDFVVAS